MPNNAHNSTRGNTSGSAHGDTSVSAQSRARGNKVRLTIDEKLRFTSLYPNTQAVSIDNSNPRELVVTCNNYRGVPYGGAVITGGRYCHSNDLMMLLVGNKEFTHYLVAILSQSNYPTVTKKESAGNEYQAVVIDALQLTRFDTANSDHLRKAIRWVFDMVLEEKLSNYAIDALIQDFLQDLKSSSNLPKHSSEVMMILALMYVEAINHMNDADDFWVLIHPFFSPSHYVDAGFFGVIHSLILGDFIDTIKETEDQLTLEEGTEELEELFFQASATGIFTSPDMAYGRNFHHYLDEVFLKSGYRLLDIINQSVTQGNVSQAELMADFEQIFVSDEKFQTTSRLSVFVAGLKKFMNAESERRGVPTFSELFTPIYVALKPKFRQLMKELTVESARESIIEEIIVMSTLTVWLDVVETPSLADLDPELLASLAGIGF